MDIKLHKKHQMVQESHFWFKVRDNLLKDIAKKYFKQNGKVLDFGCNYGHSTRLLQSLGYEAFGLDVSSEAISHGRSLGIKNIFLDSEEPFQSELFDAVVALDVLEHIENDREAFRHLTKVLRSGGVVVIMVPAYMFLWGVQDVISHHFRRYTMGRLVGLSGSVGDFTVLKKSYFNTILFMPIVAVRLFTRFFVRTPRDSDLDMNSPFINKLFFKIFDFERRLLRYFNMPFGVSILLVLRKK